MCNSCVNQYFPHLSEKSTYSDKECIWFRAMANLLQAPAKEQQKPVRASYLRIVWDNHTKNKHHPLERQHREHYTKENHCHYNYILPSLAPKLWLGQPHEETVVANTSNVIYFIPYGFTPPINVIHSNVLQSGFPDLRFRELDQYQQAFSQDDGLQFENSQPTSLQENFLDDVIEQSSNFQESYTLPNVLEKNIVEPGVLSTQQSNSKKNSHAVHDETLEISCSQISKSLTNVQEKNFTGYAHLYQTQTRSEVDENNVGKDDIFVMSYSPYTSVVWNEETLSFHDFEPDLFESNNINKNIQDVGKGTASCLEEVVYSTNTIISEADLNFSIGNSVTYSKEDQTCSNTYKRKHLITYGENKPTPATGRNRNEYSDKENRQPSDVDENLEIENWPQLGSRRHTKNSALRNLDNQSERHNMRITSKVSTLKKSPFKRRRSKTQKNCMTENETNELRGNDRTKVAKCERINDSLPHAAKDDEDLNQASLDSNSTSTVKIAAASISSGASSRSSSVLGVDEAIREDDLLMRRSTSTSEESINNRKNPKMYQDKRRNGRRTIKNKPKPELSSKDVADIKGVYQIFGSQLYTEKECCGMKVENQPVQLNNESISCNIESKNFRIDTETSHTNNVLEKGETSAFLSENQFDKPSSVPVCHRDKRETIKSQKNKQVTSDNFRVSMNEETVASKPIKILKKSQSVQDLSMFSKTPSVKQNAEKLKQNGYCDFSSSQTNLDIIEVQKKKEFLENHNSDVVDHDMTPGQCSKYPTKEQPLEKSEAHDENVKIQREKENGKISDSEKASALDHNNTHTLTFRKVPKNNGKNVEKSGNQAGVDECSLFDGKTGNDEPLNEIKDNSLIAVYLGEDEVKDSNKFITYPKNYGENSLKYTMEHGANKEAIGTTVEISDERQSESSECANVKKFNVRLWHEALRKYSRNKKSSSTPVECSNSEPQPLKSPVKTVQQHSKFTPKYSDCDKSRACAVRFNTDCKWTGDITGMASHIKSCHPSLLYTSTNQKMFILQFFKKTHKKYFALFNVFNNFFRLSYAVDAANGSVTFGMYYLRDLPNSADYCFEIVVLKKYAKPVRFKAPCILMLDDADPFLNDSYVSVPRDTLITCTEGDNQRHLFFIVKIYKG